jgi:hypothetical protein
VVCVSTHVSPVVVRLGHGKRNHYCSNEKTYNNTRIVGFIVFYALLVISKESMQLVLTRTSYDEF